MFQIRIMHVRTGYGTEEVGVETIKYIYSLHLSYLDTESGLSTWASSIQWAMWGKVRGVGLMRYSGCMVKRTYLSRSGCISIHASSIRMIKLSEAVYCGSSTGITELTGWLNCRVCRDP